jgi:endonuclease/exonuclease/phosphatase family metal-dependent hydrolase
MRTVDEQYGDAILSRWPISSIQAGELPSKKAFPFRETRGALWVEIATPFGPVQVMNTHFGVGRGERLEQATALSSSDWIGAVREQEPLIVMGDFNSFPGSSAYKILTRRLRDAAREHGHPSRSTFPTVLPCLTLDYLFVNDACTVHGVSVCVGREARVASDHFPLLGHIVPHCHTRETTADPVGAM